MICWNKNYTTPILCLMGAVFFLIANPAAGGLADSITATNQNSGYNYNLSPGEYFQDIVKVRNSSDQNIELIIYTADSTPTNDGKLAFKQKRQRMVGLGSWVRFYPLDPPSTSGEVINALYDQPGRITSIEDRCSIVQVPAGVSYDSFRDYLYKELQSLIPDSEFVYLEALTRWCDGVFDYQLKLEVGEEIAVPFVIIIPRDVEPGEHIGGILLEEVQPAVVSEPIDNGQTERVAISVKEIVPGEIIREVTVVGFSAQPDDNKENYNINIDLQNDGNVSQDLEIAIEIKNKLFNKEEHIIRQYVSVLRNSSLSTAFAWPVPKVGKYSLQAVLTVDTANGEEVIKTPELVLTFIPWLEIFLTAGLLILLVVFWFFWRGRRQDKVIMNTWKPYMVRRNDTIEFLAEKCRVTKKQIIKINDLPKPFKLSPGKKILLPAPVKNMTKRVSVNSSKVIKEKMINIGCKSLDSASKTGIKRIADKVQLKKIEQPQKPSQTNKRGWLISIIVIIVGVVISLAIISSIRETGKENNNQVEPPVATDSKIEKSDSQNTTSSSGPLDQVDAELVGEGEEAADPESVIEEIPLLAQDIQLWVLNGSGTRGLAGKMAEQLKEVGFAVSYVGNAEHFGYETTTVYYQLAGDRKKAEFVSQQLEDLGYNNIKIENNIDIKNISIVIGTN